MKNKIPIIIIVTTLLCFLLVFYYAMLSTWGEEVTKTDLSSIEKQQICNSLGITLNENEEFISFEKVYHKKVDGWYEYRLKFKTDNTKDFITNNSFLSDHFEDTSNQNLSDTKHRLGYTTGFKSVTLSVHEGSAYADDFLLLSQQYFK